jgi:hypothetical protein
MTRDLPQELLSAKEIAVRVARSEDDAQSVFERIRHWTREGLLTAFGEPNPGTGRKRQYEVREVPKARLFNELADFGVNLRVMKRLAETLDGNYIREWSLPGMNYFLVIEGPASAPQSMAIALLQNPDGETLQLPVSRHAGFVLAVNLSRIFAVA